MIPPSVIRRIEGAVEKLAGRALRLAPAPVGLSRLAPARARIADELFERRRAEVERAQRRLIAAWAAPPELRHEAGADPLAEIARLAEELVAELRGAMVARARIASVDGMTAILDGRLPTEAREHIDDPAFSERRRTAAIRSLDRLNRLLGSYVRFLDALEPLLDGAAGRTATVLDLASGHGGFPLALAALARARGRRLRVIASDVRPEYVEIGRRRARADGEGDVEFRVVNAFRLSESFAPGEIDVVTCTQSLHHFGAGGVAALVAEAARNAGRGILFVDAARSISSMIAIGALTWLTSFDPAFSHDGVISLRKAFVPEELALVARCAPGGDRLDAFYLPPGFAVLRTRRGQRESSLPAKP